MVRQDDGYRSPDNDSNEDEALLQPVSSADSQPMQLLSSNNRHDEVRRFARANNLMHNIEVFEKAASLLHSEELPEHIPTITRDEVQAIQHETSSKWNQAWTLYFTIFVCSMGAIEQGTAQTSMNGANLYFPKQFGIGSDSPRDKFLVGLINSGIYLSVGIFGAWLSAPLNNRLGRRGAIFTGSLICLVANIASALSQNWQTLLAFRIFLGAGLGIDASTISVFAAECAPSYIRGGLAVFWQMFTAFGAFLGFVANVVGYNTTSPWRFQLAFPVFPTLPLVGLVFLCPESPAWLMKRRNRYDLAFHSLRRLRNTEIQAAREVYLTYLHYESHEESIGETYAKKVIELFTIPRVRRATLAASTVMLSQQLCGINIIAFYSSTIFSDAGFTTFGALLASTLFGFINFIGAWPAVWTMDTLGRRSLLLLTLPFMAVTMFAAGQSFNIPETSPARFGLLATMIYLFCAEYSPGVGPVPTAYSAEVFPISHREVGMSLAIAVANIWASVLSLTFPRILSALQPTGAFSLYAAFNILAFVLVFLFVPETRMKTLEELDEVFSVSSRRFAKHQVFEYLPWWIRRFVLRQQHVELKQLEATPEYGHVSQDDGDIEDA